MGRYTNTDTVLGRFPRAKDKGVTAVESNYVFFAEAEIDALLSPYFTTPFSSDNITAKDLATELTVQRLYMDSHPKEANERRKAFDKKIEALISGEMAMISSGGIITAETEGEGETLFSTTEDYHSAFGVGDIEDFEFDDTQVDDEDDDRS